MKVKHAFAVCAYKESPFLEECIKSLVNQSVKSNIIIATSTPNDHINGIAEKYNIRVYVNKGETGITQDWNFAYASAVALDVDYVTIAHQDDVYDNKYVENLNGYIRRSSYPLIFFTDYAEIRNDVIVNSNKLLKFKRFMLLPLKPKILWKSIFVRRRILSFGCPICCPSVTFCKKNLPEKIFYSGFSSDEDWEAWEKISKRKGEFIYCNKKLTLHRIHEESETSKIIGDNRRIKEDYAMFCRFWPKPIAKVLAKLYSSSEKSNEL